MDSGDARFILLLGSLVLAAVIGKPSVAMGGAMAMVAWHGFDLGREMNGWSPSDNPGTVLMLGFFAFVLCALWAMTRRGRRRGEPPVVPPRYFVALLGSLASGFAAGLASKTVIP